MSSVGIDGIDTLDAVTDDSVTDDSVTDDSVTDGNPTASTPPVFTVLDSGVSLNDDGTEMPTIVIDPVGHPEVADLARVHAVEGVGDIATEATLVEVGDEARANGVEHVLVLAIRINVPVHCVFAVAIALPEHRRVIDHAIESSGLVIATTAPERASTDRPLWLAIDLDPTQLAALLP